MVCQMVFGLGGFLILKVVDSDIVTPWLTFLFCAVTLFAGGLVSCKLFNTNGKSKQVAIKDGNILSGTVLMVGLLIIYFAKSSPEDIVIIGGTACSCAFFAALMNDFTRLNKLAALNFREQRGWNANGNVECLNCGILMMPHSDHRNLKRHQKACVAG